MVCLANITIFTAFKNRLHINIGIFSCCFGLITITFCAYTNLVFGVLHSVLFGTVFLK